MYNYNIGITGLAGSGKDTAADLVMEITGRHIKKSFAEKLKNICVELGWDGFKDEKGRKLLQNRGMTLREYDADGWVNLLHKTLHPSQFYVIPDVRFVNEINYIQNNGGKVIKITRPSLTLTETHNHISEAGQKDLVADYEIVNDGSIEELKARIKVALDTFETLK